jgi:hypothetical protein
VTATCGGALTGAAAPAAGGDRRVEELKRGDVGDAARHALMSAIGRGQSLVNYIGHGSVDLWSGNLLSGEDARQMRNAGSLSIYVLMTCLNGYFHDAAIDSLAESLMKAEGGAALVWASSGMSGTEAHVELGEAFYREVLAGGRMRIGDLIVRAKAALNDEDVKRTWVVLGDPAMGLR